MYNWSNPKLIKAIKRRTILRSKELKKTYIMCTLNACSHNKQNINESFNKLIQKTSYQKLVLLGLSSLEICFSCSLFFHRSWPLYSFLTQNMSRDSFWMPCQSKVVIEEKRKKNWQAKRPNYEIIPFTRYVIFPSILL